jgi:hypothetical protein
MRRAAFMSCDPLPDWDWDWDWVTLGSPLGHPRATQAPRKGHPRVELRKCFVCNTTLKKRGGGANRRDRRKSENPKPLTTNDTHSTH